MFGLSVHGLLGILGNIGRKEDLGAIAELERRVGGVSEGITVRIARNTNGNETSIVDELRELDGYAFIVSGGLLPKTIIL
jgi:hypothetical protein